MSSTVEIIGGRLSPADLKVVLTPHIDGVEVRLDIDERASRYRSGPGAEVLVAYIAGGTAALSSLITGVFALLTARRSQECAADGDGDGDGSKIVLHGADGSSVECPADATREELDHLVDLARRLGTSTIELP